MKNKILDILIIFLALYLGIFFFHLIRTNAVLNEKVASQGLKASALIEELGQTRAESQMLFQKVLDSEKNVKELRQMVQQAPSAQIDEAKIGVSESRTNYDPESREPAKVPRVKFIEPAFVQNSLTRNFLIAGQHSKLTDTIIIAMISEAGQKITLLSIPRDLFVNGRKINEYFSRYGASALKQAIEEVTGLRIENYVILNFKAFETLIDALNGIDLYVEKAIYDPAYPDPKGGYMVYSIEAGPHHLDGQQALMYARSRHSTSDFDRAKRQQKILSALQERFMNFDIIANMDKLRAIYDALKDAVETDIGFTKAIDYAVKFKNFAIESGNVLSTSNLLYPSTSLGGQYILLPRGGDWGKVKNYVGDFE